MSAPAPSISPELKVLMRRLKLGRLLTTLPERLALARSHELGHVEFLEQLFSDEVSRRDAASAGLRAKAAKLDPHMVLEAWDEGAKVTYDRAIWSELVSMRFVEQARNAFIMGPVGVGKTFMATALGHIACRRRIGVHFERHDRLHKRLKAARLDASYDHEMRKLIGVDLLVIDDFALQPLDMLETADVYELCVERHHAKATVLTSNRDPSEWLSAMADPLLAQSAVDRLKSAAWELVIEGESYRQHEKPTLDTDPSGPPRTARQRPTHLTLAGTSEIIATAGRSGRDVVPCFWQRGGPLGLANDTARVADCQGRRLGRAECNVGRDAERHHPAVAGSTFGSGGNAVDRVPLPGGVAAGRGPRCCSNRSGGPRSD
jgi:DNA replication protein DnaC